MYKLGEQVKCPQVEDGCDSLDDILHENCDSLPCLSQQLLTWESILAGELNIIFIIAPRATKCFIKRFSKQIRNIAKRYV